jgi:hypothetical protein
MCGTNIVGIGLGFRTRKAAPYGMDERLDPHQVVTLEELLRSMMYETEAVRRVLVQNGLLTNEEVLEEIKAVRREVEGKRGGEGEALTLDNPARADDT